MSLSSRCAAALALGAVLLLPAGARAQPVGETIIFVRHGEKPEQGLGQLSCKGLNRALALPAVLETKFGRPAAIYAPNPSEQKEDGGKAYSYIRPLATIEPSAIRFSLPVDTRYGFRDIDKLKLALEQPGYRQATVVVAWEHHLMEALVRTLVTTYGGDEGLIPKWHNDDFDGIYVVAIDWSAAPPAVSFSLDRQGLDGLSKACPS